jgi:hypothetical protein
VTAPALLTIEQAVAAAERIATGARTSNRATTDASELEIRSIAVLVGQLHAIALAVASLHEAPRDQAATQAEHAAALLRAAGYLTPEPQEPAR